MEKTLPKGLSQEDYEVDERDGFVRELVGPWVEQKHRLLRRYVDISGTGVRRNWLRKKNTAGATYIDLYCGPGRVRIRESTQAQDGGPLVAWSEAERTKAAFTSVFIADANAALADAAEKRLLAAGAPVHVEVGEAAATVDRIVSHLNPNALHFAFLDPYSLGALPFEVVQKLARLRRMDILIHVSLQDLSRNLRRYASASASPLDAFAPGWRQAVGDFERSDEHIRGRVFEHWRKLLESVGMKTAEVAELVVGPNNQPLYWLAFVARHDRAMDFWEKIRDLAHQRQSGLF
jgi:three-Cys-motif partner protein